MQEHRDSRDGARNMSSMKHMLLAAVAFGLVGCDWSLEKLGDAMSGREINRVVLAAQPLRLSEVPTILTSAEPMKVIGERSSLCLVLKDGVTLGSAGGLRKALVDALAGAKVETIVVLDDGSRVTLQAPMQAWARSGRVLSRDELSGCASASCGVRLPTGAQIKHVELSAAPTLQVRGVYWESQPGINEKRQTKAPGKVALNATIPSKCPAS